MTLKKVRLSIFIIFMFALLIPVTGQAKEVDTLKELIKMYDSTSCKQCHAELYQDWEKSLHSKAMIGPYGKTLGTIIGYVKARETELKKSKEVTTSIKDYLKPCLICHIPQMMELSEKGAQELAKAIVDQDMDVLTELNVNCLVCHNRNAIVRKFKEGNPEKDTVYGPNKTGAHGHAKYTKLKQQSMMKDPAFCGQCHQGPNVTNSDEPMWCVSNYDSYLQNYIPNGGDKTCQECHMQKDADNKTGHRFPPNYDDPKYEMKRLKEHIKLDMSAFAYIFRIKEPEESVIPTLIVRTKVSHDIGHRFPDGCPSPTHFGLDIVVKGPDGKVLFKEKKYYMPQKKFGYEKNDMTFASFRKLSLMRDTALQPFKDNKEEFEFKLPPGVEDVTVEANLYFFVEPLDKSSKMDLYSITKKASISGKK